MSSSTGVLEVVPLTGLDSLLRIPHTVVDDKIVQDMLCRSSPEHTEAVGNFQMPEVVIESLCMSALGRKHRDFATLGLAAEIQEALLEEVALCSDASGCRTSF